MTMHPRKPILLCSLAACLALVGCAGYQVGSTLPRHLRTVAVPAFTNKSGEPQIESAVTRATLQEFQRDGTLALADIDSADVRVTGAVVGYTLDPVRYERDSPSAVLEYRIVLRAAIQAVERATGTVLVDAVVEGDATFRATGDITTAKRSALPNASRDLAHEIVNRVVSAW